MIIDKAKLATMTCEEHVTLLLKLAEELAEIKKEVARQKKSQLNRK